MRTANSRERGVALPVLDALFGIFCHSHPFYLCKNRPHSSSLHRAPLQHRLDPCPCSQSLPVVQVHVSEFSHPRHLRTAEVRRRDLDVAKVTTTSQMARVRKLEPVKTGSRGFIVGVVIASHSSSHFNVTTVGVHKSCFAEQTWRFIAKMVLQSTPPVDGMRPTLHMRPTIVAPTMQPGPSRAAAAAAAAYEALARPRSVRSSSARRHLSPRMKMAPIDSLTSAHAFTSFRRNHAVQTFPSTIHGQGPENLGLAGA